MKEVDDILRAISEARDDVMNPKTIQRIGKATRELIWRTRYLGEHLTSIRKKEELRQATHSMEILENKLQSLVVNQ